MHKLQALFRRFFYKSRNEYFTPSNAILALVVFAGVGILISGISSVERNWSLQEKIQQLEYEKTKVEIEVDTLTMTREYYKTDEYQELMARKKLGKMAAGETMVILPQNSTEAKEKHVAKSSTSSFESSNLSQWLNFLFGDTRQKDELPDDEQLEENAE